MTRIPEEPSNLPGRTATVPLSKAVEALGAQARVRVTGVRSGARGHVIARALSAGHGPVLAVAADEEAADALADDLAFFLGGAGTRERPVVLRLPDDEAFLFDELSPNRAVVQERLAALFHLRAGTASLKALVISARGLARKQLPVARLDALTETIRKGQSVDRDVLARRLVERGFQSAPVVEDAGTFSVRGGLLDVWSPAATKPARLEFFGDEVESIKSFDPESQRTIEELKELALCPATELLFTDEGKKRARAAALEAADAVNRPTTKTRELLDAIAQGVPAVGLDAVMPRLHPEGLAPLSTYLDVMAKKPLLFVDDPLAVQRALEEFDGDLGRAFSAARSRGEIALDPREHYLAPKVALTGLDGRATLESLGLYLRDAGPEPLQLSLESTTGLREAIVSHHGEDGALSPLVEKLRNWSDTGLVTAIACGSVGGADKLKRLLLDRNTMVKVHAEPFPSSVEALRDPSVWAHLFPGDLSGGFVDRDVALAVLSDEEIFGARQWRRARARRIDPSLL